MEIRCEACIWYDDGLCDRLGYFVDPDDKCEKWERVSSDTDKEEMYHETDNHQ